MLVATLAVAVVGAYLRSRGHDDVALGFGVGYYAHLAGDAVYPLVAGRWADIAFLGWPLLPAAESSGPDSVVQRFVDLMAGLAAGEVSAFFAVEVGLVVLAAVIWAAQGCPGLGAIGHVRSSRRRSSE